MPKEVHGKKPPRPLGFIHFDFFLGLEAKNLRITTCENKKLLDVCINVSTSTAGGRHQLELRVKDILSSGGRMGVALLVTTAA